MCESVRSIVLLPWDWSHHLTQNDAANAGIYGDLVQSEVGNAALYRDLVQTESANVGVYLYVLVRCADLKPPYIKTHCQQLTWGALAKVFLQKLGGNSSENVRQERVRKFCGKFAKFLGDFQRNFCNDPFLNDPLSEWLTLMVSSKSTGECTWDDWSMSRNTSHGTSHNKYRIRCHCHHKQY